MIAARISFLPTGVKIMIKCMIQRKATAQRVLLWFFMVWVVLALNSQAHAQPIYSFIVTGDTRTEPYMPGGPEQENDMRDILKIRYGKKGETARLVFDEHELQLVRVEIKEKDGSFLTLNYHDGWPRSITRTQNKEKRVIMREAGRQWVFDRVAATISKAARGVDGEAQFLVHCGDISLFGLQGKRLDVNPYWQIFEEELLSRIPPPDMYMNLPGRVFAAVGNHTTWQDEEIKGLLTTLPWLSQFGLRHDRRIYSFPFKNSRFIILDSGGYDPSGTAWSSKAPPFKAQMDFLATELKEAERKGTKHVFVVYHKPSFVRVGHDPLPKDQSPHNILKQYAAKLKIFVFNGHNHTTEQYQVDDVHYLVLGGGGSPQKFELAKHPSQNRELYWQGLSRVEEYNYLEVKVKGKKIKGLLHRFRPTQTNKPFEVVELFRR